MISADSKDTETAQEIKISCPVAVIEIWSFTAAKADIITDHLEHPHQLLVAVAAIQLIAIACMTREQCAHVQTERIGYNACCERSLVNTIGRGLLHCAFGNL